MSNRQTQLRIKEFYEDLKEVQEKEKTQMQKRSMRPLMTIIYLDLNDYFGDIYNKKTLRGQLSLSDDEDVCIRTNFFHPFASRSCNLLVKGKVLSQCWAVKGSSVVPEWANQMGEEWVRKFHENLGLLNNV